MGAVEDFKKPSYFYKMAQEKMGKSYRQIHKNKLYSNFIVNTNKFVADRKKIYKNINSEDWNNIDWKSFLIDKFYSQDKKSWKYKLYMLISVDKDKYFTNYRLYLLQNKFFVEQFYHLNLPPVNKKIFGNIHVPIMTILTQEELKSYSEKKIKKRKKEKNESIEIELKNVDIKTEKEYDEDEDKYNSIINRKLTEANVIGKEPANNGSNKDEEEFINKLNSYRIQRLINLIRVSIEEIKDEENKLIIKKTHPIYIIIDKFSKYFTEELNQWFDCFKDKVPELHSFIKNAKYNCGDDLIIENSSISSNSKEDIITFIIKNKLEDKIDDELKGEINYKKMQVIKDIQSFIDTTSISLKLFYSKSINYQLFISEKDEFINLISYFLFKENDFYNNIFNLFELSNIEKYKKLRDKKNSLGELSTKDAGINQKFRLDENNKKNIDIHSKEKKEKPGIIQYFEKIDEFKERYASFNEKVSKESSNFSKQKFDFTYSFDYNNKKNKIKNNKNKEKSIQRSNTITTYKEFSEIINKNNTTLKEKLEADMDNNPSTIDFPEIKDSKNELNIPYGEAIYYFKNIKDYNIPLDKLTIIALVSVLITDCIDEFWKTEMENLDSKFLKVDADELISIYLYIIYNLDLPSLYTQLDFIENFTGSITKQSMIGYYFASVVDSLEFIMSSDKKEELLPK